jgi:hypothetical protein
MDLTPNGVEDSWAQFDNAEYYIVSGKQSGRHSTCLNEDDYDYAIELKLDDEYRQAANAVPDINEFDDLDDEEIMIILDERNKIVTENRRRSSANFKEVGIAKYMRNSLSLSPFKSPSPSKRQGGGGYSREDTEESVIHEQSSPLQKLLESDIEDIETGEISSKATESPCLKPLSHTRVTPLRGDPGPRETTVGPRESNESGKRWTLSSVLSSVRPISLRLLSVTGIITGKEPLNPVTVLFEPHLENPLVSAKRMLTTLKKNRNKMKSTVDLKNGDSKALPPAQFLGWSSPGTQIWARLVSPSLSLSLSYSL